MKTIFFPPKKQQLARPHAKALGRYRVVRARSDLPLLPLPLLPLTSVAVIPVISPSRGACACACDRILWWWVPPANGERKGSITMTRTRPAPRA